MRVSVVEAELRQELAEVSVHACVEAQIHQLPLAQHAVCGLHKVHADRAGLPGGGHVLYVVAALVHEVSCERVGLEHAERALAGQLRGWWHGQQGAHGRHAEHHVLEGARDLARLEGLLRLLQMLDAHREKRIMLGALFVALAPGVVPVQVGLFAAQAQRVELEGVLVAPCDCRCVHGLAAAHCLEQVRRLA